MSDFVAVCADRSNKDHAFRMVEVGIATLDYKACYPGLGHALYVCKGTGEVQGRILVEERYWGCVDSVLDN